MKLQLPILFALGTALCWGCYGPMLGQARLADGMRNSPFKPYVFIGIAYVVWALLGGLVGMSMKGDEFKFFGSQDSKATAFAFFAGTLGAWGALNLTLAMSTGGAKMPHVVMPVVFGGAVTVTAIVSMIQFGAPNKWLLTGIVGMGISIVLVAANTPHHKKEDHAEEEKAAATEGESPSESKPNEESSE